MITHPVLTSLTQHGVKLGLERIGEFLAAMGDPHLAAPVVLVAGTNGKGSVVGYVTEALVAAGYRVGTNTSPHLEHVNERIRLDGVPIDDGSLDDLLGALDRFRWSWARKLGMTEPPLTYFELVTAAAFRFFAERRVDVMVIEVGMGGRLDATNITEPVVTAITSIGLDHIAELGGTLEAIAYEKAGIMRAGVPCAVGPVPPDALATIRARASVVGAPLWTSGTHLQREHRGGETWVLRSPEGQVGPVTLAMRGTHQGANAAVAVGVLHALRQQGFVVPDEAIVAGLERARIAGRLEQLRPGLVIDGAHNADGAAALASWLESRPRPASRILLFGLGVGRDPTTLLTPLLPHVDEVVLTRCAHPKAMEPLEIAERLGEVRVTLSDGGPIDDCLAEVYTDAEETLVAGSLYLAGAARSLVEDGLLEGLAPGSAPG